MQLFGIPQEASARQRLAVQLRPLFAGAPAGPAWAESGQPALALWRALRPYLRRAPDGGASSAHDVVELYLLLLGRRAGAERAGEPWRHVVASIFDSPEFALRMLRQHGGELAAAEVDQCLRVLPINAYGALLLQHLPPAVLADALARGAGVHLDEACVLDLARRLSDAADHERLAALPALLLRRWPVQRARTVLGQLRPLLVQAAGAGSAPEALGDAQELVGALVDHGSSGHAVERLWRTGDMAALLRVQDGSIEYLRSLWACVHRDEPEVPTWLVSSLFRSNLPWRIEFVRDAGVPHEDRESVQVLLGTAPPRIEYRCPDAFVYATRLRAMMPILDRAAELMGGGPELSLRLELGDDSKAPRAICFSSDSPEAILVPDPYYMEFEAYRREARDFARLGRPFAERRPMAYWRGTDTGLHRYADRRQSPRVRVCELALKQPQHLDARIASVERRAGWEANRDWYQSQGLIGAHEPIERILEYRYNLDIDGNANAWNGLFLKLLSGSVVLKVDSEFRFRQWYYARMEPWVHFVPIRSDLADLIEQIEHLERHPGIAAAIAENGRRFALGLQLHEEIAAAALRVVSRGLAGAAVAR